MRRTVEDTVGFSVRDLRGRDAFGVGATHYWYPTIRGQRFTIAVTVVRLDPERCEGSIGLAFYPATHDPDRSVPRQPIELAATEQPFGGLRWWFICPMTGVRVAKLHRPYGGELFASRRAHDLAYRTQRMSPHDRSPHDRALHKLAKLEPALAAQCPDGDRSVRSYRMRWETYVRYLTEIECAGRACDAHIEVYLAELEAGSPFADIGEDAD